MPKTGKTLTKPLYTFLTPLNRRWVVARAKAANTKGYSAYMNQLITRLRTRSKTEGHKKAA